MISFRYHIVSIVAVFLALAVGLLAGSAFVEPELVDQLRTQTDRLRNELAQRETELAQVRADVAALEAFAEAARDVLARDRLGGVSVVVVTLEGMDERLLGQTQTAVSEAGAELVATISARPTLVSGDPTEQGELATILGRPTADPVDLPGLAAASLAERLAPADRSGLAPEEDVLNALLSAGFLVPVGAGVTGTTLERIGTLGQAVVVLGGGPDEASALLPEAFALPLVRSLAARGVPVAAGEPLVTDVPFVALVREAGVTEVVTVDDLDRAMGGAALVLGLEQLLSTGRGGAYGVKDGANPLPEP